MSSSARLIIKDNSISSKLLGVNLNDINIVRRPFAAEMLEIRPQWKDKHPTLTTLTNEFSPEVIFTATLPGQGLGNINALADCGKLMVLNLSKNGIENITPLKGLVRLCIIDLS